MKLSIALAALLITINCMTLTDHEAALSDSFTLKFEYAAKQRNRFSVSAFTAIFNNVTLLSITPTDYDVHTASFQVTGVVGENILNFAGTGDGLRVGAAITNVRLIRAGNNEDIVTNGNFDQGLRTGAWNVYAEGLINGWKGGEIEIGKGHTYNRNWLATDKVCELNAYTNVDIYQSIYLNEEFQLVDYFNNTGGDVLSNKFTLKFEYAAKQRNRLSVSSLAVYFNNVTLLDTTPEDYKVHTATFQVTAVVGENILNFVGTGDGLRVGAAITNVRLIRAGNNEDVVTNGQFDQGLRTGAWNVYADGLINGWEGGRIEIGKGHTYNRNWLATDKVCELNAYRNVDIYQSIHFDSNYVVV